MRAGRQHDLLDAHHSKARGALRHHTRLGVGERPTKAKLEEHEERALLPSLDTLLMTLLDTLWPAPSATQRSAANACLNVLFSAVLFLQLTSQVERNRRTDEP